MDTTIGLIFNFFLVVIGFSALFYQSRSVKIAEKDLRAKVVHLSELLQKIEEEGKQREKETVNRINSQAELIESQASMYRELLSIGRGYERGILEHLETVTLSTSILAKSYQLLENTDEKALCYELMAHIQKVHADMIDLINFSQEWAITISDAGDESKLKRDRLRIKGFNNINTVQLLSEELFDYEMKIKQIQSEHSSKASLFRNKYDTSKALFIQLVKKRFALNNEE